MLPLRAVRRLADRIFVCHERPFGLSGTTTYTELVILGKLTSSPLKVGAKAPDFKLPDQDGNDFRLYDQLGSGPVVLFFYPKSFSAVCTAEACSFRDSHEVFTTSGASVIGISADSVKSQRAFATRFRLDYPVLSDRGAKVHAQYGVRNGRSFVFNDRVTFVIDRGGIVRHTSRGLLAASPHVEESLEVVRGLLES